jgi:adenosine/AMP kinase
VSKKKEEVMEVKTVAVKKPEDINIIIGQSHFIKTVEDLYEALISSSTNIKFGFAFCEASGKALVRAEGNDKELKQLAVDNAYNIGAGHSFFIALKDAFPINVLNQIKMLPEVCRIFCASANPLEVVVAETSQGRGILGVIDGLSPKGKEGPEDIKWRKDLLRKIGYKL